MHFYLLGLILCHTMSLVGASMVGNWYFNANASAHLPEWATWTMKIEKGSGDVALVATSEWVNSVAKLDRVYNIPSSGSFNVPSDSRLFWPNADQGFRCDEKGIIHCTVHSVDEDDMRMMVSYPLSTSQRWIEKMTEEWEWKVVNSQLVFDVKRGQRALQYLFDSKPAKNTPQPIKVSTPIAQEVVVAKGGVGSGPPFVMHLNDDWNVKGGLAEKALLLSLQGLSSRIGPILYFLYPSDWDFTFTGDLFKYYQEKKGLVFEELTSTKEAMSRILPLMKDVQHYVVWDPDTRTSLNIAFTIAGVYDCVVIAPSQEEVAKAMGLTKLYDLVGQFTNQSDIQIYTWAIEHLLEKTATNLTLWNGGVCGDVMQPAMADWGIKNRAFFTDLSTRPEDTEEYTLAKHVLARQAKGTPYSMVMGWHSYCKDMERTFSTLSSSFGLRIEGLNTNPNIAFESNIGADGYKFVNHHTEPPAAKNVTYIAAVQTDGLGLGAWNRPGRGSIPYTWEVTVNYHWIAPGRLQYFYEGATQNDYFIGALSLPGYGYPKAVPTTMLPHLVEMDKEFAGLLDLNAWEMMDYSQGSMMVGNTDLTRQVAETYWKEWPESIGWINGYGPSYTFGGGKEKSPLISFDYYLDPTTPEQSSIDDLKELIALNQARPYFLLMHVREYGTVQRTKDIIDALGDDVELVALDSFLKLAKQYPTFRERFEGES